MKKHPRYWLVEIAVVFLLLLMIPNIAPACIDTSGIDLEKYSGVWEPTDETVFTMDFGSNTGQAYIYDFETPEAKLELFDHSPYANIFFTEVTENGMSSWYADKIAGGQSLPLGENPEFGISLANDSETFFDYYVAGTSGEYALMASDMDTSLLIHDAEKVHTPIPGAALLLGSGLFGLAAVRRKS